MVIDFDEIESIVSTSAEHGSLSYGYTTPLQLLDREAPVAMAAAMVTSMTTVLKPFENTSEGQDNSIYGTF